MKADTSSNQHDLRSGIKIICDSGVKIHNFTALAQVYFNHDLQRILSYRFCMITIDIT